MSGDTRIYHIRNVSGPHKHETFPTGGITVAVRIDGQFVLGAIGVCGHKHTFSRKQGRKTALGRIEKMGKKRNVKFTKVFSLGQFGNDNEFERALTIAHILVRDSKLKGKQRRTAIGSIEGTRMQRKFLEEMTGSPNGKLMHNFKYDCKFDTSATTTSRIPCDTPNETHPGGTIG